MPDVRSKLASVGLALRLQEKEAHFTKQPQAQQPVEKSSATRLPGELEYYKVIGPCFAHRHALRASFDKSWAQHEVH